jgi:hypothetical protein
MGSIEHEYDVNIEVAKRCMGWSGHWKMSIFI